MIFVGRPVVILMIVIVNCVHTSTSVVAMKEITTMSKWIPIEEAYPEKYDCYLVMWKCKSGSNRLFYEICEYTPPDDVPEEAIQDYEGEWEKIEQAGEAGAEIVAWMPLPEPYEPKEAKKNGID